MAKNLLIVESPAKAKTIEKFLGKDFTVKSSFGHVRDLPKGDMGVDIENDFKPKYVTSKDKTKVIKELRASAKKADEIWLATDEDREGEAISWHLAKILKLDETTTKRIVFREITKSAIQKAVTSPRTIDLNLVDAQQARRVLDRLVGYKLSELLWKKVKGNLSAGRVQSVSVKLIVDREREITKFQPKSFFKIKAIFHVTGTGGDTVKLEAESAVKYEDVGEARNFLEKSNGATFKIATIDVKPVTKRPSPPFTTSTLQQEASRKLGFAVKRTMMAAQRLYEQGLITYMRTDSVTLSETALKNIEAEIKKSYGANYSQLRRFKNKKALAQEAHEAIRPSYIERKKVSNDRDQQRLYELIWKRTIASQMAEAKLEKTIANIAISTIPGTFLKAEGEVLKFDGFLKVYMASTDDDNGDTKGMLPPLKVGQVLDLDKMTATERFTKPPARYTEASLVKKMEELGIGRPSTYAPTISKIMEEGKGYVAKGNKDGVDRTFRVLHLQNGTIKEDRQTEKTGAIKNRLIPLDMGYLVTDFLSAHFKNIMNYGFTADVEKQFDEIASGKRQYAEMLKNFYFPFIKVVNNTLETAEKASGERILGKDPVSGKTLLVRMARFGPVVQIGKPDELAEGEKQKYANLPNGFTLENITYEDAIKLFELPKTIGQFEGKDVIIGAGRFGPYVKYDDKFISLARNEDPFTVTLQRATELILQKRKSEEPVGSYDGKPYTMGKGRFGPFLKWDGMFINIPRRFNPETLTEAEAHELIKAKIEKEANRYIHKWEDEKISVENGRWGPFIRFGKKNIKIPREKGEKITAEMAKEFTLEQVKAMIEAEIPGAFKKKTRKKKKA